MGLVKCGAWGCFDEFNRLEEATLSAISMQIHKIQEALRTNAVDVELLEQHVSYFPFLLFISYFYEVFLYCFHLLEVADDDQLNF